MIEVELTEHARQRVGSLAVSGGQAITVFHDMIGRGHGLAEAAPMPMALAFWLLVLLGLAVVFFRRQVARRRAAQSLEWKPIWL